MQDLNKRQGLALLTKVGESVKHVAGGYKLRARPVEFCAMGEYLDTFSQKLGTIDRIAQRILKEQSGIDDVMTPPRFGSQFLHDVLRTCRWRAEALSSSFLRRLLVLLFLSQPV